MVIDYKDVEVVNSFNLLGVLLDNNLKFKDHVSKIKKTVNFKFISQTVKIQFFKLFKMPNFDYCASLYVFFW